MQRLQHQHCHEAIFSTQNGPVNKTSLTNLTKQQGNSQLLIRNETVHTKT